jgi:hypothetical protein
MQLVEVGLRMFSFCLMSLLVASNSHAQIYRWVDANGKTHYSDRKDEARNAKIEELKLKSQPISPQGANSSAGYGREQDTTSQQRKAQIPKETSEDTPVATRPTSLSGGKEDGTDASRCALARDVLSGAVRHGNGAPTDKYDREVAENDIRLFCH